MALDPFKFSGGVIDLDDVDKKSEQLYAARLNEQRKQENRLHSWALAIFRRRDASTTDSPPPKAASLGPPPSPKKR